MPIIGSCEAIAASVPSKLETQRPPAQSPLFRWKKSMTEADMGASRWTSGDEWYSTQRRPWSRRSRPRLSKLRKVTCGARCRKMAHGGIVPSMHRISSLGSVCVTYHGASRIKSEGTRRIGFWFRVAKTKRQTTQKENGKCCDLLHYPRIHHLRYSLKAHLLSQGTMFPS